MKNLCFVIISIFIFQTNTLAQERKDLMFSFSVGSVGSPASKRFDSPKIGIGYALDMSYFITARHIISLNYTSGTHEYIEPYLRSWLPTSMIPPTSSVEFRIFSLLYKYRVLRLERFSLALGTGLSLQTEIARSPDFYKRDFSTGTLIDYSYTFGSIGSTDLSFPFKAEMSFNLSPHWAIGLESGIYYMPTIYPWSAVHFLPRVSYIFR